MKYIYKFFSITIFLLIVLLSALKGQETICDNDTTVVFRLDGYKHGQIIWQKSTDNKNWINISNANNTNLEVEVSDSIQYRHYRAKVSFGTCQPYYSETYKISSKPTAYFSATPSEVILGDTVHFEDLSHGNPIEWKWNFGDNTTSEKKNPSHVYTSKGNYGIELAVSNSCGVDSRTISNYISAKTIEEYIGEIFLNWYNYNVGFYDQPAFMMGTSADAATSSWGNFAMRDMSYEPRIQWDNSPSYDNAAMTESYYKNIHSLLNRSNEVLKKLQNPNIVTENESMAKAVAKLGQGISLGYLSLVFDKAYIITEHNFSGQNFEFKPYMEVRDSAIASLDKAISIADTASFSIPYDWINTSSEITNERLSNLTNFLAAKILISSARNNQETQSLNWSKILSYAQNGLEQDFTIFADGNLDTWSSMYHYYGTMSGWARVDMRLVDMLDNQGTIPPIWPSEYEGDHTNFPNNGKIQSNDARVNSDFQYMESRIFNANRGYYHFSTYRYTRFDHLRTIGWPGQGEFSLYRKAENDYMIAEALVRANDDISGAKSILDNSARTTRGGLTTPSGLTKEEILEIIFYERHIELFSNNLGIQYFDMRRFDLLQQGTPLHFPIPGAELETLQMDNYTFGGASNADGENTADEGWKSDYEANYGGSGAYYNYNW
jgi:PKD repeat protein